MKRAKNLYPKIYSWETLVTAYRKARKGKRKFVSVATFDFYLIRQSEE